MTLLNIGFDFDEPLYPWYDLAHRASVKAGIALPEHEPTSWAPHEAYGCTLEEWVAVLDNEILNGDMYHQPLIPGVVDEVKRLYRRGFNVHIITARGQLGELGPLIKRLTRATIIREGLPVTSLTFTGDKVEAAKRLEIDYMIDDHPKHHNALVEAGINSFLMDAPWNQDDPEKWVSEGGRRVKDTFEYVQMVLDQTAGYDPFKRTPDENARHNLPLSSWAAEPL